MYRSLWFEFKRNLREEKDHNAVAENESKKAENQEVFADDELEQIWLTDKTNDGMTELTCLADFPKHPDANVAKRYLTGRYGRTPRLSPSLFAVLVDAGEAQE